MRYIFLLLLASCTVIPQESMTIRRVLVNSEEELRHYCGADLVIEPLGCAKGGALTTPPSDTCTIYALKDRGYDDHRLVETQGHELKHCFEGAAHR